MFELKSCKITRREKRGDASNMFTVHIAYYESIFVDENNDEYVYQRELIYVNKVPSLVDCLNDAISVFYKKHITFIEICNMIGSRYFDLYINAVTHSTK